MTDRDLAAQLGEQRESYWAPELTHYGRLDELTQGALGKTAEKTSAV